MLQAVETIARKAGQMMLEEKDAQAFIKEGHFNFVTETDLRVQQMLEKDLWGLLPESCFFGEEKENKPLTDAPTWIVDPIDGTMNFMRTRRASAVSIALVQKKQPVLAVVYQPYTDELYTAQRGQGAFCNGEKLHVSNMPLERAVTNFGTSPYDSELLEKSLQVAKAFLQTGGDLRRSGSAVMDLCDVAAGRADVFVELRLRPWDVAAGCLLIQEAGGVFTSIGEKTINLSRPCGALAGNRVCFDAAQKLLMGVLANA